MKIIKEEIVFFIPDEPLNSKNIKLFMQEIFDVQNILSQRVLKGIFISLKNVLLHAKIAQYLVFELDKFSKNLNASIAIGDFVSENFVMLCDLTKESSIKLFKNQQIARMLFHPQSFHKSLFVVLLQDDDENEIDKIASVLSWQQHRIIYVTTKQEFETKLQEKGIDFGIYETKLNKILHTNQTKHALGLSKILVTNLPIFIDTAVENLEMLTNFHAKKITHSIITFQKDKKEEIISAVMKFRGDLEGVFVLLFPKQLAVQTLEIMLEQKLDDNNKEALADGIAEICNIITGGTKTLFSKKNIKILFDLPKTYNNLALAHAAIGDLRGIWIDMQLGEKAFYIFITK
ncbi:MAG: chemotaxis protein CheX [Sulfurospirillum sp.]|nr:chemotaxis protein CheX [Sulfurospirillum sp.]